MKMINLNEENLEVLEIMYALLLEHKNTFLAFEFEDLCLFFTFMRVYNFIDNKLHKKTISLINYISDLNNKDKEVKYWFPKSDYELTKKYLKDLIKYNKKGK